MRKQSLITMAVAILFSTISVAAWAGDEHKGHGKEEPKKVTLEGEVLDMYCFMKHPDKGMGAEHAKCAKSCISKGLPIGFMSGGEVYLIVGKDHESAADMVAAFAGMQSKLTGMVVEHHGVKAIEIESIEKI